MPTIPIELPHVGESVVEGIIDKWLKKPGDRVEKYDPLVEIATDKVNMEVPSPYDGVLTRILVKEGATVPMGTIIAEIETEDQQAVAETVESQAAKSTTPPEVRTIGYLVKDATPMGPTGGLEVEEAPSSMPAPAPTTAAPPTARGPQAPEPTRSYSPVVMKLAQEYHVDLTQVKGTGLNERVTKKDVLQYIETRGRTPEKAPPLLSTAEAGTAPAAEEVEEVKLSPIRRIVAQRMTQSASQIPHAWSMVEVDVSNAVRNREAIRAEFQKREGIDLTLLPFVIKAVVESLKENPLLNSTWAEDKIIVKKRIHIGVAVAATEGLVVPVIHNADSLSIAGLNRALRDLADRARQGKLALSEVQRGTFTVNNTGALGSVVSQPLINYPQAAIITTEAIQKRPAVMDDAIAICSMMNLCLSFDHRILDGSDASVFLQAVKRKLEHIGTDTPIY